MGKTFNLPKKTGFGKRESSLGQIIWNTEFFNKILKERFGIFSKAQSLKGVRLNLNIQVETI